MSNLMFRSPSHEERFRNFIGQHDQASGYFLTQWNSGIIPRTQQYRWTVFISSWVIRGDNNPNTDAVFENSVKLTADSLGIRSWRVPFELRDRSKMDLERWEMLRYSHLGHGINMSRLIIAQGAWVLKDPMEVVAWTAREDDGVYTFETHKYFTWRSREFADYREGASL